MAKTKQSRQSKAGPNRAATGAGKRKPTPKQGQSEENGLAVKIGRALSHFLRGATAPKPKPPAGSRKAPTSKKPSRKLPPPDPAATPKIRKSSAPAPGRPGPPKTTTPHRGTQTPGVMPWFTNDSPDSGRPKHSDESPARRPPLSISDEGSPWRRGSEGREGQGVRPRSPRDDAPFENTDVDPDRFSPKREILPPPEADDALPMPVPEPVETDLPDATDPPRPRLSGNARRYALTIEQTLAEFGAPVRVVHAEIGPMLIRFGIVPGYVQKPARGDQPPRRERVRAAKVVSRSNDLALALGVTSLRIEAPVPGKTYIGVEIPNPHPKAVPLPPLLEDPTYQALLERGVLPIALGSDVAGHPILADLARQPHLLIAGSTGSGKSVAVNSLIGTLLKTRTRDDVRVIVVDPKRVEFTWLEGVPQLLAPVVTEAEQAVEILGKVETEMAHRYDLLAAAGCRNRLAYNARPGPSARPTLPALVVVIDELADLMMMASDDVERSICRVAQLGRAAGIHLVVATQRPSVDVITGLIKANLPARLAFAVSSLVDSRTILDTPGAEHLLGRGDFLYLAPDAMRPVRGQGALARDSWLKQTVKTAREALPAGTLDPEAARFAKLLSATQIADDRMYARAKELVQDHPKVSASFLQRRLRVGLPKAEAFVERLRADGIIPDPDLDDE